MSKLILGMSAGFWCWFPWHLSLVSCCTKCTPSALTCVVSSWTFLLGILELEQLRHSDHSPWLQEIVLNSQSVSRKSADTKVNPTHRLSQWHACVTCPQSVEQLVSHLSAVLKSLDRSSYDELTDTILQSQIAELTPPM